MRIISFLFLSFFVFNLTSCSSDDNGNQPADGNQPGTTVLGKWNLTKFEMAGSGSEDGDNISFSGVSNSLPGNDVTFLADNTFDGNSAPFVMQMNFIINGMSFNMPQPMSSITAHAGEWTHEGNFLYIKNEDSTDASQFTIVTLNASTLIITGDQDSLDMGEDFPADAEFIATVTFTR